MHVLAYSQTPSFLGQRKLAQEHAQSHPQNTGRMGKETEHLTLPAPALFTSHLQSLLISLSPHFQA